MSKLLYLDVEYANCTNKSICQIGLLSEQFPSREPVFPEKDIYINPEDDFDEMCTRIHGICKKQVQNEPNFPKVWTDIKKYFDDCIVVGHNVAASDLSALAKCCQRYNLELPNIRYIDTRKIAFDYVPYFEAEGFSLEKLAKYFDIDVNQTHNAFDDACVTSDLFEILVQTFNINIEDYINVYEPNVSKDFVEYVSNPVLRQKMTEFYGIIQGFSFDEKVRPEEESYIKNWKNENKKFANIGDVAPIFKVLDDILEDNIITIEELQYLKYIVERYYRTINGSFVTNSLEELRGILKGISVDNIISTDEGQMLLKWLYRNIYLSEHYPYNYILPIFQSALADNIITKEESDKLIKIIDMMLNPVEILKEDILTLKDKHICLSGNFAYGKKSEVAEFIKERGGFIDENTKKTTNILVVGEFESQSYAHGNYGTKVRKAMEFNQKGAGIIVLKEKEFFNQID